MTKYILKKNVTDLREEYLNNGVVVIKNAINSYWVNILRDSVELQVQKNKRYFDNRNMRMQSGGFNDFCHK